MGLSYRTSPVLLVEDLTEGGKRELLTPEKSDYFGNVPMKFGDTGELVYVDLDDIQAGNYNMKLKYMEKDAMINL